MKTTIFSMAPEGELSYLRTDDARQEMVRALMRNDGPLEAWVEAVLVALPMVHEGVPR